MKMNSIFNNKKFKYGGYAAAMTIFVIVVVLLLNYLVTTLDEYFDLSADMTATRIYSLTQQTKDFLAELDQDIYIYTTYSEDYKGMDSDQITELVDNYKSQTSRLHYRNIDVVLNPGAKSFYEHKGYSISSGNIIVSTSDDPADRNQRFKVLDRYDIYSMNPETNQRDMFAGEEAITSAILFVTNPDMPKVWILAGHNTDDSYKYVLKSYLEDSNYEVEDLNLVTSSDQLEKGDLLICLSPNIDLSDEEREVLADFALEGGKLFLGLEPEVLASVDLPNFRSLLSLYNIEVEASLLIETDPNRTYFQDARVLLPGMASSEMTSQLITDKQFVLLPGAGVMTVPEVISDSTVEIETLLMTSNAAFAEPFDATMDGLPNDDAVFNEFPVMVAVTKTDYNNDENTAKMIVTSCPTMFILMEQLSAYGGNDELFMNAITWLSPVENDIYIRGKSLNTSQLYIKSSAQQRSIMLIVCILLPILLFAIGVFVFMRRRHL